jgi:tRNA A-37 threonylcarbamoyl transferase component Bud32
VTLKVGTLLDKRYRLDARIGRGGMSTVYRAFDVVLEREVAVKVLHSDIAADSEQLERFRREARSVAKLSHPHIASVIDAGEDEADGEGEPYIVFEYVEGETLKQRIQRSGRLAIPEAVAYAIEIARALGAAHDRGIVHRDVKPQNVLVDRDGSGKVTDFGIARTLDQKSLTAAGRVLGTTDYVSPEQALGQDVTGQSDIYSLGIVLFEMLTGDVPFHGDSQVSVAMKHVREEPPDVQLLRPDISSALAAVVDHCTAKDLKKRYPDTEELIADLEEVLAFETARTGQATGEAAAVLRTLPPGLQRLIPAQILHPARAAAIAVVLALVLTVILIAGCNRGQRGTGQRAQGSGAGGPAVSLGQQAARSFDPPPGDGNEHSDQARFALDDDPATSWSTETYSAFTKPGVGLYVDAAPGVVAHAIGLATPTPGFNAEVYGAQSGPPSTLAGWTKLATAPDVQRSQRIGLSTGTTRYRYYLIWITALPPGVKSAEISELVLYR